MMNSNMMNTKEMNFSVADLKKVIKENRDKHAEAYAEAVIEYKTKLRSLLLSKLDEVEKAIDSPAMPSGYVSLAAPQNHLEEYDQYLEMLDMTEDTSLSLPISMFNQLVRDRWSWKQDFDMLKTSYSMNQ